MGLLADIGREVFTIARRVSVIGKALSEAERTHATRVVGDLIDDAPEVADVLGKLRTVNRAQTLKGHIALDSAVRHSMGGGFTRFYRGQNQAYDAAFGDLSQSAHNKESERDLLGSWFTRDRSIAEQYASDAVKKRGGAAHLVSVDIPNEEAKALIKATEDTYPSFVGQDDLLDTIGYNIPPKYRRLVAPVMPTSTHSSARSGLPVRSSATGHFR